MQFLISSNQSYNLSHPPEHQSCWCSLTWWVGWFIIHVKFIVHDFEISELIYLQIRSQQTIKEFQLVLSSFSWRRLVGSADWLAAGLALSLCQKRRQGKSQPAADAGKGDVKVHELERLQRLPLRRLHGPVLPPQPGHDAGLLHLGELAGKDVEVGAGGEDAPAGGDGVGGVERVKEVLAVLLLAAPPQPAAELGTSGICSFFQ